MKISPYQNIAETYEAIRPSYPEELMTDLAIHVCLSPDSQILEIGAGTGKATQQLLSFGCQVDALELEPAMAEILAKKLPLPNLHIIVSPFESWIPQRNNYSCICCAQSFHWLDAYIKFQKCWDLLSPSGSLALIWYDPIPSDTDAAQDAANFVYQKYFHMQPTAVTIPITDRTQELRSTAYFQLCFQKQYDVILQNTPIQALLALHSTPAFSELFSQLSQAQQSAFHEEYCDAIQLHGGYVNTKMRYSLYLLKPVHEVS